MIVFGCQYYDISSTAMRAKIDDKKLDERPRDNRISNTIRSIEIECFYILEIESLRLFHTYDDGANPHSYVTCNSQKYEVGMKKE
jgi:hypothetical protein